MQLLGRLGPSSRHDHSRYLLLVSVASTEQLPRGRAEFLFLELQRLKPAVGIPLSGLLHVVWNSP
jgi:hypothetical protein